MLVSLSGSVDMWRFPIGNIAKLLICHSLLKSGEISLSTGRKIVNCPFLLWTPWWFTDILQKQGASHAATRLLGLQEFKAANTVKINPDAPQKNARFLTLEVSQCILFSIPFFTQGSHQTCCSIKELDVFNRACEIKVDPDKPLEGVRLAALQVTAPLHPWGGGWDSSAALDGISCQHLPFLWREPCEASCVTMSLPFWLCSK